MAVRFPAFKHNRCKNSFLRAVEGNRAEFLPIADQRVLCKDLVNSNTALAQYQFADP
jgi:hypothetical protein